MKKDIGEMMILIKQMSEFQLTYNELKKDYLLIYDKTVGKDIDEANAPPLIRGCIKECFSLMEANIFLYNVWNPYENYNDRDGFIDKFKKTFKHHSNTFPNNNRLDTLNTFKSNFFDLLLKQFEVRHQITHPKSLQLIRVTKVDLEQNYKLYQGYTTFIAEMFRDVMIDVNM